MVDGQRVAGRPEGRAGGVQGVVCREHTIGQLEHDPAGRQHGRNTVHQEAAADVDERPAAAGEGVEADREQTIGQHVRGRLFVGRRTVGRRVLGVAVEQLVAEHAAAPIEDRLTCDKDPGGGRGGCGHVRHGPYRLRSPRLTVPYGRAVVYDAVGTIGPGGRFFIGAGGRLPVARSLLPVARNALDSGIAARMVGVAQW